MIAADILERLDPLHRKAFALHLDGFKYTSSDPDESIAVLLGRSPQTIKTWVDRIAVCQQSAAISVIDLLAAATRKTDISEKDI